MSDSRALGGGSSDENLPAVPTPSAAARGDRTKAGATRKRHDASGPKSHDVKHRGPFSRIRLFVSQVVAEMKKVTYPSKSETWTYFVVVIVFVAVIMAYAGLLDLAFDRLNSLIFA